MAVRTGSAFQPVVVGCGQMINLITQGCGYDFRFGLWPLCLDAIKKNNFSVFFACSSLSYFRVDSVGCQHQFTLPVVQQDMTDLWLN